MPSLRVLRGMVRQRESDIADLQRQIAALEDKLRFAETSREKTVAEHVELERLHEIQIVVLQGDRDRLTATVEILSRQLMESLANQYQAR